MRRAAILGVELRIEAGELHYRAPSLAALAELDLDRHAESIIAILREHSEVPSASTAVERAASIIRMIAS